jgi:hypothetical protein
MPEAHQAVGRNHDPLDALGAHERAVRAAGVLKQPVALLLAQDGVLPRDARVSDHDVRVRISPDSVTAASVEHLLGARHADPEAGAGDGAASRI